MTNPVMNYELGFHRYFCCVEKRQRGWLLETMEDVLGSWRPSKRQCPVDGWDSHVGQKNDTLVSLISHVNWSAGWKLLTKLIKHSNLPVCSWVSLQQYAVNLTGGGGGGVNLKCIDAYAVLE